MKFSNSMASYYMGASMIGLMMAAQAAPVMAQEQRQNDDVEEVLVTGRRILESKQDIPAAVTVMSEATLRDAGVERAEDFIALTPGVTIVDAAEVGDTQVNIRGINGSRDAENSFAFIVDGILMTNPAAFNREYADLKQIEIMKGPQGAIYGRNASAGAIIVNTHKPSDTLEAKVKASYSSNKTSFGSANISGPISDTTGFSVGGDVRKSDGFYKNEYLDAKVVDNYNGFNLNGRIYSEPSDTLSIDAKMRYGEVKTAAIAFNAAFALPAFVNAFGFEIPTFHENVNDHDFTFQSNIDPLNKQKSFEASVKVEKDLGWADLTVWSLYSDIDNWFYSDGTGGAFGFFWGDSQCQASTGALFDAGVTFPAPTYLGPNPFFPTTLFGPYTPTSCDGTQFQQRNQKDISIEARLSGEGENSRWEVGAYYLNIDRETAVSFGLDTGNGVIPQPYNASGTTNPTEQLVWDDYDSTVYAVFGQYAVDVSDRLELSAALRYDREERKVNSLVPTSATTQYIDYDGDFFFTGGAPLNAGLNPAINPSGVIAPQSQAFTKAQPKITATYDIGENMTVFANWGIGFKSGGFNSSGSAATIDLFLNDTLGAGLGITDVFKAESSSAFEVGFKGSTDDRRITYEAAAFQTNVNNMQFFEFFVGGFGLLRTVSNIDDVTIKGFEGAVNVKAHEYISLNGGFAVTDSKIKANSARPDTVGNKSPYTADYTMNAGAQFTYPVSDGMDFMVRADWNRVGPTWFHTVQDQERPTIFGVPGEYSRTQREAYNTINLRGGLQAEGWTLNVFVKNLSNTKYLEEIIPAPEFGGSFIHPGSLRTWGVELTANF